MVKILHKIESFEALGEWLIGPSGLRRAAFALALGLLPPLSATAAERQSVSLELLLAVDSSSSVSDTEFALQMEGIARSFEDPQVIAAIEALGPQGLAVGLMQWSSLGAQSLALDWTQVGSVAEARALAGRIRRIGRLVGGGSTSMSAALSAAIAAIEHNGFAGTRRVIDVSGDGTANEGESPALPRAIAIASGITINGLAILNEEPDLAHYYRLWVVGGPESFLLTAVDYRDFAEAMRRKLLREIQAPPIARAPRVPERYLTGLRP